MLLVMYQWSMMDGWMDGWMEEPLDGLYHYHSSSSHYTSLLVVYECLSVCVTSYLLSSFVRSFE
jgi:hypothetical protein